MEALLAAVRQTGLPATRQFPSLPMPRVTRAAVAVGLQEVQGESSGFGDYLGIFADEKGNPVERYGKRITARCLCRIFAPDGSSALTAVETLGSLVMGQVSGLRPHGFTVGPCAYDRDTDCYTQDVVLSLSAYYRAEVPAGDDPTFRDFRLECEST